MPVFALANAGVDVRGGLFDSLSLSVAGGVVAGLLLGKPLGIMLFSWAAVRMGLATLPQATWRGLHGVSWLGGIGFTMSLFIASLAFSDESLLNSAKVGILTASLIAGLTGAILLRTTGNDEQARRESEQNGHAVDGSPES